MKAIKRVLAELPRRGVEYAAAERRSAAALVRRTAFACGLLLLAGCGAENPSEPPAESDERLASRVEAALAATSDLPLELSVAVADGIVTISGDLACDECGGNRTPGTTGTVQQSLGVVVRAVPGVDEVRFQLDYDPPGAEGRS